MSRNVVSDFYLRAETIFVLVKSKLTLGEEFLRQVGDSDGNEEVQDHDQISEGEPLTSVGVVSLKNEILIRARADNATD